MIIQLTIILDVKGAFTLLKIIGLIWGWLI